MCAEIAEGGEDKKFARAAFDFALFEFPCGGMRDEDGVQAGVHGGIDVTAWAIADHPTVRFDDFKLVDHALVGRRILFNDDFDRVEVGLQTGALDLCSLFGSFAFCEQDQAIALGKIRKRFGHAVHDVRRSVFEFGDDPLDFLQDFATRAVAGELCVCVFERTMEAADTVSVLADVATFGFVEDVANVFARVAEVFELINEMLDRLLEEDVVFPERVVCVDKQSLTWHRIPSDFFARNKNTGARRGKHLYHADEDLRGTPAKGARGEIRGGRYGPRRHGGHRAAQHARRGRSSGYGRRRQG